MTRIEALQEQPEAVEIKMADGIFIKQMSLPRAGMFVLQHVHAYDHTSMLATGSVRMWRNGVCVGDFKAPTGIMVLAGVEHQFQSLVPDTLIYCIHNISRTGAVDVLGQPVSAEVE